MTRRRSTYQRAQATPLEQLAIVLGLTVLAIAIAAPIWLALT